MRTIEVAPRLRMRVETDCYVLEEERLVPASAATKKRKALPERWLWAHVGYYAHPAAALDTCVRLLMSRKDATESLGEFVDSLRVAAAEIRKAMPA